MGQVTSQVKAVVDDPDNVFLINRLDGSLVTPSDIEGIIRVVEGRGV